jgi:hypothetical protein
LGDRRIFGAGRIVGDRKNAEYRRAFERTQGDSWETGE